MTGGLVLSVGDEDVASAVRVTAFLPASVDTVPGSVRSPWWMEVWGRDEVAAAFGCGTTRILNTPPVVDSAAWPAHSNSFHDRGTWNEFEPGLTPL